MNEECLEFSGREHFLPPSISNEPVCVGTPIGSRIVDLLPAAWRRTFPGLRDEAPQVLGSGSRGMEVLPDEPAGV